jgi:hypothetical protein
MELRELGTAMKMPSSILCAYSVPVRLKRMFSSLSAAAFCMSGNT